MVDINERILVKQLLELRLKIEQVINRSQNGEHLAYLLHEVNLSLEKVQNGTYGLCETCHEPIEYDRLKSDPFVRNCLDHLSSEERSALERDLDLAWEIQQELLPRKDNILKGWEFTYHYEPAGLVSGDYCDLMISQDGSGSFYFLVGDVSGKGIAASLLMTHLHATFHTLVGMGIPLTMIAERANRIFCEVSGITHFATLVCGLAINTGEIELFNAGHWSPLLVKKGKVKKIESTGLPLGLFHESRYSSKKIKLETRDHLILYTDGLIETRNETNEQYGVERLINLLESNSYLSPIDLKSKCLNDLDGFRAKVQNSDDLTLFILGRN